jgi:hypothetical protein
MTKLEETVEMLRQACIDRESSEPRTKENREAWAEVKRLKKEAIDLIVAEDIV